MHVTEIYNNLIATDRMVKHLEADRHFSVENLDDLDAFIPMIAWWLWIRGRDESGQIRIIKGPHYECNSVKVGDAMQVQRGLFFRIAGRIVFATLSKDLEFNETKEYKVDISNGEIYVYPSFIDSVGFPFPK